MFVYNIIAVILLLFQRSRYANSASHRLFNNNNFLPQSTSHPNNETKSATVATLSEYQLAEFLFRNYSCYTRPRRDASEAIAVTFGMKLYSLNEIVERTHEIIVTASLTIIWRDEFLTWQNVPPYSQIGVFVVPSKKIWLPDIALTNSGDMYAFTFSRGMMAVVYSNGAVEFFPEATVKSFCQFDLTYFPFDHQICEFQFESWSYITDQQTFDLVQTPINIDHYDVNEQWHLVDTYALNHTTCYNYDFVHFLCYPAATFRLLLQRKSGYYSIMIIIPSIIFSVVELVTFSLPLAEVSKLQITFTCLLSYTVFQTTVRSDMPRISENDPLLSIYFDLQMAFIAFALAGEACVFLSLQQAFTTRKPPGWLTKILFILPSTSLGEEDYSVKQFRRRSHHIKKHSSVGNNNEMTTAEEEETTALRQHHRQKTRRQMLPIPLSDKLSVSLQNLAFINDPPGFRGAKEKYPSRDVIIQQMLTTTTSKKEQRSSSSSTRDADNDNNNNNDDETTVIERFLPPVERKKWEMIASRIEKFIIVLYTTAVIVTPLLLFYLARIFDKTVEDMQQHMRRPADP